MQSLQAPPPSDSTSRQDGDDLVVARPEGLYCPPGDFYIDPWRPVERAVITHAHSDHARTGHTHYLAHTDSAGTLRTRPGDDEVAGVRGGIGRWWDGHHHAPSSQQRDAADVGHQADSTRGASRPFGSVLNYFWTLAVQCAI